METLAGSTPAALPKVAYQGSVSQGFTSAFDFAVGDVVSLKTDGEVEAIVTAVRPLGVVTNVGKDGERCVVMTEFIAIGNMTASGGITCGDLLEFTAKRTVKTAVTTKIVKAMALETVLTGAAVKVGIFAQSFLI